MYLLTTRNRVIDYCDAGYVYVGNDAFCESKGKRYEDATIVYTEQSLPVDIDTVPYDYINGKFIRVAERSNNSIYSGTEIPSDDFGEDGDIFFLYDPPED